MSKANEPAYPAAITITDSDRIIKSVEHYPGLTKREKLAMEIYARLIDPLCADSRNSTTENFEEKADYSIRAADIFFEQMEKHGMEKQS